MRTQISNTSKDLSDMTIHVEAFAFNIDDQNFTGDVLLSDLQGNSKIKGKAKGNIDLSSLSKAIPLDQNINLSGLIDLDLSAECQ